MEKSALQTKLRVIAEETLKDEFNDMSLAELKSKRSEARDLYRQIGQGHPGSDKRIEDIEGRIGARIDSLKEDDRFKNTRLISILALLVSAGALFVSIMSFMQSTPGTKP